MKYVITENQHKMMTEENIRKLCYTIWDKQKKKGEEPNLDDVIYDITGVKKNTREDLDTIRPLWYEYNGGYDMLFEKLKDEIDTKEYKLVEAEFDLETTIKVVHLDIEGQFVEIMVDVDPRGTIEFNGWNEDTDEEYTVNDTIDAAYHEALLNYEGSDFEGMIRSSVYDFFYALLEKYGIPIDVDIDLQEIHGAPYGINESQQKFTRKSDIIKNIWDKEEEEKGYATFDEDILQYFNITDAQDKYDYSTLFTEYIGGFDKAFKIIDKITMNDFNTKDFPKKIVGGYNFEWIISNLGVKDGEVLMESEIANGGTVTLIGDGRTVTLYDAIRNNDYGWEIESEVREVVEDCMNFLIRPKTGIKIGVQYVSIK